MMPRALGSAKPIVSSQICSSSCPVHGSLSSSLLDSKPQGHLLLLSAPGLLLQGAKSFWFCFTTQFISAPFTSHCRSPRSQPHSPGPLALTGLNPHCTTLYCPKQSSGSASFPFRNHHWLPIVSRIRLTFHAWHAKSTTQPQGTFLALSPASFRERQPRALFGKAPLLPPEPEISLARKSFSGEALWDVASPAGIILWAS